jgi:hypothetical protein
MKKIDMDIAITLFADRSDLWSFVKQRPKTKSRRLFVRTAALSP